MTPPALIDELMNLVEPGKVLTDPASLEASGKHGDNEGGVRP
jgi:hypothetical protein